MFDTVVNICTEPFMLRAFIAVGLAGTSCALVGVLVFTLRLSALGVCISHVALAGALGALLWGMPPLAGAMGASLLAAIALGLLADKGRLSLDSVTNVVFSASVATVFLLFALLPGPKAEAFGWFWGNVLTIRREDLTVLGVVTGAILVAIRLFYKEILALLFNRELAAAAGIPVSAILYGVLICSGAAVAASLSAVGGLLVFSLLVNPVAAAYQFSYRLWQLWCLASIFAVLSGWIGLVVSAVFNLPSGATIALSSTGVLVISLWASPKRRRGGWT